MKKMIGRLMAMCLVPTCLAAFAQSGGNMKQDDMKKDDSMTHDDGMKQN
jgi:hypothetical protein